MALVVAVLLASAGAAPAGAAWTTFRGDGARSGIDSSSTGQLPFAPAWTSPLLSGTMWGQPVVAGGLVVVGTEADQVYALNESTGAVVWHAAAGTAVPSSQLPCGDISPTVGITSTPVIDPATQRVLVVADTWDGSHSSSIAHRLYAFDLATGAAVPGYPMAVDAPGSDPTTQLQRAALALTGGEVVIGYGGNDGDCGNYNGWLVGAPEAGGALRAFEVEKGYARGGGAIWGAGDGPAVDAAGNVWAASGNGFGGYGYQESVLDLTPDLALAAWWAPSNWSSLDSSDTDIGSTEPLLLPGGLVFQIGKAGVGYLLSASALGGTGAAPRYQASVCSGSFGGAIYYGGVIYVACSDGLRALALKTSAPSFSALAGWHVPGAVNGPPIESGGLIWATTWNGATLYGLNPQTGAATVIRATPPMEHFTTPSASDGKLFLATGTTVEAYTIANPAPAPAPPPPAPGPVPPAAPPPAPAPIRCTLRTGRIAAVTVRYTRARRGHRRRAAYGTLAVSARCAGRVRVAVGGTVTETIRRATRHHRARLRRIRLRVVHVTLAAARARTVRVRVPLSVVRALQRRVPASAVMTLSAPGATPARARIRHLRLTHPRRPGHSRRLAT